MRYTTVGRTGLEVSALGLGCNNFGMRIDQAAASRVVGAALDCGITLFDTADIYAGGRSEEILGKALGARRDDVVLATKFGGAIAPGPYGGGSSRRHVIRACEAGLRRLGTDHIDLYFQHYPDPRTPIEETLAALDDLVRAGKIRYAAASNLAAWQLADAVHTSRARGTVGFAAVQLEWNLLSRAAEHEAIPAAAHFGVGVIPYFPLASGLLTGKYRREEGFPEGSRLAALPYFASVATDANFAVVERLRTLAENTGRTMTGLALSWLVAQPTVASVLVGATSAEQVAGNAAALEDPSPELLADVTEAAAGHPG
ncbi:aldo/keto reductase [Embleya hyalina]|uniref:NADP-dependent aryl-alcohol dehydrogenase n=1 Tax=Embleya hyalina TaxID=516124 RepID=A0A401YMV1_9ACTN|nr:aldo/keto reductase [Embleya hyalina]GCD95940.1 NADP-dependent aryl-alcohol dehydrogenase [Embleya hyalina]